MPIQFAERFVKQYERLPKTIQGKVDKALRLLDADFRHPGLRSHPVEGVEEIFEASVDAKYRMTFERHGNVFVVRNVDNHDECLKNP
ncbi:MAG: cytotoxin [Chloroflexi bacterium]|nr:cytotoxin [Chloroflexota bacterium]